MADEKPRMCSRRTIQSVMVMTQSTNADIQSQTPIMTFVTYSESVPTP